MREEHRRIQEWVKENYAQTYRVESEVDQQNHLPDRQRHWYQPDIVLRNGEGEIKYIIEVENDPVRKALVGACILADYSIAALGQRCKPALLFVVYTEQGIRQIPNFIDKLQIAKQYCPHLERIEIYSEADFKRLRL